MPLAKLTFKPGINKENTSYSEEGGWVDCDKVRFKSGTPEKIGGWDKYLFNKRVKGVPRAMHVWQTYDGTTYLAIATHIKVYAETGNGLTDITPFRATETLTGALTTSQGSNVITVEHVEHGALDGAYIHIAGADELGGVPASEINAEHEINWTGPDSFTFRVDTEATLTETNTGLDVVISYEINPGRVDGEWARGWGVCPWGAEGWGQACQMTYLELHPRTWSLDTWGEDLVINAVGGPIYVWDVTYPDSRAEIIEEAPHKCNVMIVTKEQHMIAFGSNWPGVSQKDSDIMPLMIYWCDQGNYTDWTPTSTNTSGFQELANGTEIIAAGEVEAQTLVWTDSDVQSMQFVGPPYTFGIQQVGSSTGIMGPYAWAAYNNVVYWMAEKSFYVYQGGTQVMPSTVQRYVFDNVDLVQRRKIFGAVNLKHQEISWFYPVPTPEPTYLNGTLECTDPPVITNVLTYSNQFTEFYDEDDNLVVPDWDVPGDENNPITEDSAVVCISVIDESSPGVIPNRADWLTFREDYPYRPFYLLRPLPQSGDVATPVEFDNDVNAFGPITVQRTGTSVAGIDPNGHPYKWHEICNLAALPDNSRVLVFVDNSGSMYTSDVAASIQLLEEYCASRNIEIYRVYNGAELWVRPFITSLSDAALGV